MHFHRLIDIIYKFLLEFFRTEAAAFKAFLRYRNKNICLSCVHTGTGTNKLHVIQHSAVFIRKRTTVTLGYVL